MFDQPFRTRVRLAHFAPGAIATEKPVVAQRTGVFLLRDANAFSRLFLEALQLTRSYGHVRADLEDRHDGLLYRDRLNGGLFAMCRPAIPLLSGDREMAARTRHHTPLGRAPAD